MSGTVGGDLATLRQLHRTLSDSAISIENVARDIDRDHGAAVWTGKNADDFAAAWAEFKPTLTPKLVDALNAARDDVRTQHNNLSAATGESDSI